MRCYQSRCLRGRRSRHIYRYYIYTRRGFFAAIVDEEVSWSGSSMIFARLSLEGSFFELGCFFLRVMTTIQSTNVVRETLYMSTRHRLLNSFISSLLRKLPTQLITSTFETFISPAMAGRWSQKLVGQPLRRSSRQGFCKQEYWVACDPSTYFLGIRMRGHHKAV